MDYVTHLTAIRVDEHWQETEQLKLIMRPLVRYWSRPVHTQGHLTPSLSIHHTTYPSRRKLSIW